MSNQIALLSDELSTTELEQVSGGLNPQPLPPYHGPDPSEMLNPQPLPPMPIVTLKI